MSSSPTTSPTRQRQPLASASASSSKPFSFTSKLSLPLPMGKKDTAGSSHGQGSSSGGSGLNARRPNLPAGMKLNISRSPTSSLMAPTLSLDIPTPAASTDALASPFDTRPPASASLTSNASASTPVSPHTPLPGTPFSYSSFMSSQGPPTGYMSGSFAPSSAGLAPNSAGPWGCFNFNAVASGSGSSGTSSPSTLMTPLPSSTGASFTFGAPIGEQQQDDGMDVETPTAGTFVSDILGTSVNGNGKRGREEDPALLRKTRGEVEKEWFPDEEEILSSFLMNPLRPLTTQYPPSTLPPPRALDELTSQILHFHSPEPSPVSGVFSRPTLSAVQQRSHHNAHRRTRSAAGIVWRHSWLSTRKKLFDIARHESMGLEKEDRWKGRGSQRGRSDSDVGAFPIGLSSGPPTPEHELATTGPAVRKMGHKRELSASSKMLASLSSGSSSSAVSSGSASTNGSTESVVGLVFPRSAPIDEAEDEEDFEMEMQAVEDDFPMSSSGSTKKNMGQVLRLSTSLQRSSKSPSLMMSGLPPAPRRASSAIGQPRPPSLLSRGASFTADDFESLRLSSPEREPHIELAVDSMDVEVDPSASEFVTPRKPRPITDVFGTPRSFPPGTSESPSPCTSPPSEMEDDSFDEEDTLTTPHSKQVASPPSIMLTQSSPSPSKEWGNPIGAAATKEAPGSPSPASRTHQLMTNLPGSLRRSRPAPLARSFSTNSGNIDSQEPSAFSRFMNNGSAQQHQQQQRTEVTFAAWRGLQQDTSSHLSAGGSTGLDLPLISPTDAFALRDPLMVPLAKRQKGVNGLTVAMPLKAAMLRTADAENGGLRSPFDDGGKKF